MPKKQTSAAPEEAAAASARPRKTEQPRQGGLTVTGPQNSKKSTTELPTESIEDEPPC